MSVIEQVRQAGQSLWLDNITRDLLDSGTLQRYIDAAWITGLTSNPTIFDQAIAGSTAYDQAIRADPGNDKSAEALFIELALADLRRAADLLQPTFAATQGFDGWVSMEVSPSLAYDTVGTIEATLRIAKQAARSNLLVKIPGTPEGIPAIEAAIFAGVPVNVTLLFSREQFLAAAEAYLRGVERRLDGGLSPRVASVASLFVSRWDTATKDAVPAELRNKLGIAVAGHTYRAYRELLSSDRWQRLAASGASPQRLLWASTGAKDPETSDTLYVEALVAPLTINTLPEKTLKAFAAHGQVEGVMAADGLGAEVMLRRFTDAGIDLDALALQLQQDGARSFLKSWVHLMECIATKRPNPARAGTAA